MMKQTLLAMALSALSLTAFAATDTPDILSALSNDTTQQIALMTDEQLNESRGSGSPANLTEYYYVWRNYGSQNDYRSYMFNLSSTTYGGRAEGAGFRFGDIFYATTKGLNAAMNTYSKKEELTALAVVSGNQWVYYQSSVKSTNLWNRPSGTSNYW